MAQTGFLLPHEPLFIVDKGWKLHNTSKHKTNCNVDLSNTTSFKIYKTTQPQAQIQEPSQGASSHVAGSKPASRAHVLQFVAANEPGGRQNPSAKRAVRKHARWYVSQAKKSDRETGSTTLSRANSTTNTTNGADTSNRNLNCSLPDGLPHASIPPSPLALYWQVHGIKSLGFEKYLHYYRNEIARSIYPIGKYISFAINPISGTCFPLALTDRLFLQTIMLISAIHHSWRDRVPEPKLTNALADQVLRELQARIVQKDLSNVTLLSISCMAHIENLLGRHSLWRMHASGMCEMVRLRGGIDRIDSCVRWKIRRADLVGAVEQLSKPLLPYPRLEPGLNGAFLTSHTRYQSFCATIAESRMSSGLQSIFKQFHLLILFLEHVLRHNITINAISYDDSCMRIQHDLLETEPNNPLDESWKLAGLAFMNTFTKARPFEKNNVTILSQKLRSSLSQASSLIQGKGQHLWLAYVGSLVSTETDDHAWFTKNLVDVVKTCNCTRWDDVRELLQQTLWLDVLHDNPCMRVFQELPDTGF